MEKNITDIIKKAKELSLNLKQEINHVKDLKEIDLIKIKYTGKKGLVTLLMKTLAELNNDDRAKALVTIFETILAFPLSFATTAHLPANHVKNAKPIRNRRKSIY